MKKIVYKRKDITSPVVCADVVFKPGEPVEVSDELADLLLKGKTLENKDGTTIEVVRPAEFFEVVA